MRAIVPRRILLPLILLLTLALAGGPLLTGCAGPGGSQAASAVPTPGATSAPGASSAASSAGTGSTTGAASSTTTAPSARQTSASGTGRSELIPAGTPSGPLRLFCTPRATLNPLQDSTASFQSVCQLIYEGLFAIDGAGLAKPVLAQKDSLTVAADGLSLTLRLAAGRTFHSGTAVSATDVAASYNALRAAGAASAYASRLPDITGITAADASTLSITLARPQPDFALQLTFPVLPAAALAAAAAKPLTPIPGTGPYRIAAYAAGKGLTLQASDSSEAGRRALVRTVQVIELPGLHEALRAFERDAIDLVSLPADTYPGYALRNGLKLERFATGQYVFLSFRTADGAPLANQARLAFVQAASRSPAITADLETLGVQPAAVPIHPDSPLWRTADYTATGYLALYQPARTEPAAAASLKYPATRQPLVILALQDDVLRTALASRLQGVLAGRGVNAEVRVLPADAFQAARIAGQYDILVAQGVTDALSDPRWLMGQSPEPVMPGSELLPRTGLTGYPAASAAVDRLFAGGSAAAAAQTTLLPVLGEAVRLAPYTGIGYRYAALASGSRVLGQPRPQANAIYEGIEDLWLWST